MGKTRNTSLSYGLCKSNKSGLDKDEGIVTFGDGEESEKRNENFY